MFNVLVVEDSKMYRMVIEKSFINDLEYKVDIVETIKEAKEIIDRKLFDLALFDINLPDGSGLELVKFLRKEKKNELIYILAVTAEVNQKLIMNLYKEGVDYYIKKPFDIDVLNATCRRIYERTVLFHKESGD